MAVKQFHNRERSFPFGSTVDGIFFVFAAAWKRGKNLEIDTRKGHGHSTNRQVGQLLLTPNIHFDNFALHLQRAINKGSSSSPQHLHLHLSLFFQNGFRCSARSSRWRDSCLHSSLWTVVFRFFPGLLSSSSFP